MCTYEAFANIQICQSDRGSWLDKGAAETLAISPSALNRNIQALEYNLGISVFDRLARGVALSVEGELFYRFALEQIASYDRMISQIEGVKGLHTGRVVIGLSEDISPAFFYAR